MNSTKSQNSILILTTLGVYLGLVLVGATPVLGHAAMTRSFEIQDEIEVKDDLDKKPDDERSSVTDSIGVYLQDVEYFLDNLRKLNQNGRFDLNKDTFEVAQSTQLPCVANYKIGSYTASKFSVGNEFLRPPLETFSKRLTDGYSLADCLYSERFQGQDATDSNFSLKLNQSELLIVVAVVKSSPQSASQVLDTINQTHRVLFSKETDPTRRAISNSTSFKSQKSQIFVITRLPRAGLDSLLAKRAK